MMKYHVLIKNNAIEDIDRNAQWWAEHHSKSQALTWYEAALQSLYSLSTFPESHSLAQENDSFPYEIRHLLFGLGSRKSYRAIFTIQNDVVHVLAVQRVTQDSLDADEFPADPEDAS